MQVLQIVRSFSSQYLVPGRTLKNPAVRDFSEGASLKGRPNTSYHPGIRLITVDRPGYGESSPHPGRTFLNWVPDIEQLADHLKIDRFGVLSHSGGSPYALAIAYKLKERVSKVVLASPLGPFNVPGASDTIHKSFRFLLKLGWFNP
jgi:pimeloyl-ACP methyl ester carboxylesterase